MATNDTEDLTKYQSFLTEGDVGYQDPYLGLADPGIKYDPRDQRYASDLYSYYLAGGQPEVDAAGSTVQDTGTAAQGTGEGGGTGLPIGVMPPLDPQFEQQVMDPSQMMGQLGNLEYQGTPGGDLGTGEFGLIDSSGKDFGPYTQADFPTTDLEQMARSQAASDPRYAANVAQDTGQIGRQNVTGDITDYLDPMQLDLTGANAAAAAYDGVDLEGFADPMSAGADYMPEEATPVTGITGPAGMEPDFYAEDETATGPNMADVAGPVQNITLPSGDVYAADDPQLLEKVDPETRSNTNMIAGLWEKAKGSATDFKNSLQDAGNFTINQVASLVNAFANPSAMSLAGAAGIPGMILSALAGAGTQVSPEQKAANAAFEQANNINIGSDGRITGGPLAGLNPAGKSFAGSATYEEQIDNKIDSIKNRKAPQTDASRQKIADLENMKGPETRDDAIDAGIGAADEEPGPGRDDPTPAPSGGGGGFGDTSGPRGGGADRDSAPSKSTSAPASTSDGGFGDTSGPRGGGADFSAPAPSAPSYREGPPGGGGGGGSGGSGGGKIVCTMMNDSYGFGSFRNKIWLRQSKNLAPEYQIGYHKIFLPLVKLSKKNIVLKKILEHIAVHRTIDIRQESRGKTHMLGRIYRKILEPICYWVGKNG